MEVVLLGLAESGPPCVFVVDMFFKDLLPVLSGLDDAPPPSAGLLLCVDGTGHGSEAVVNFKR